MNRYYSGFIIDADNTLFDFTKSQAKAFYRTLEYADYTEDADAALTVFRQINHGLWKDLEKGELTPAELRVRRFRLLIEQLGVQGTAENLAERFLEFFVESPDLFPETIDVLQKLSKSAVLVLATNGFADTQRIRIRKTKIGRFFRGIVISEEAGTAKPDPLFYDSCFQYLPMDRKEILCVGDSLSSDIQGGINTGLSTCLFNPYKPYDPENPIQADYRIDSLNELTGFLEPE
ncbi:MAG: YjjG family noncanonical pyrimidine nucleotidase [Spirochaetia bacterium]